MTYEETLEYLNSLNVFGMRLGLVRMEELLSILGNPQNDYSTVHVTGTNGKGSVTAMLTAILQESGFKTGMFTSPHLVSYTERMQINGKWAAESAFAAAVTEVRQACEKMVAGGNEQPTQFEVLTAAAFLLFKHEKVDYAVIEVGLGGLLDSTNVITPKVSVITNVSFEHADKCGGTFEGIAEHKAGIIKEGVPVVTGAEGIALDIIRETAAVHDADIYVLDEDFSVSTTRKKMVRFTGSAEVMGEVDYRLNLLGLYQVKNSALAAAAAMVLAVDELSITKASIRHGMGKVTWPGRFELLEDAVKRYGHSIILDGAHNPAGIKTLRESLDFYYPSEKRVFLLGILQDKAFAEMLEILLRPEDTVIFTTPDSERAAEPEELLEYANVIHKEAVGNPAEALKRANELTGADDLLICAGSLYLIGTLRDILVKSLDKQLNI